MLLLQVNIVLVRFHMSHILMFILDQTSVIKTMKYLDKFYDPFKNNLSIKTRQTLLEKRIFPVDR